MRTKMNEEKKEEGKGSVMKREKNEEEEEEKGRERGMDMKKNEEEKYWRGTYDTSVSLYVRTHLPVLLDTPLYILHSRQRYHIKPA